MKQGHSFTTTAMAYKNIFIRTQCSWGDVFVVSHEKFEMMEWRLLLVTDSITFVLFFRKRNITGKSHFT